MQNRNNLHPGRPSFHESSQPEFRKSLEFMRQMKLGAQTEAFGLKKGGGTASTCVTADEGSEQRADGRGPGASGEGGGRARAWRVRQTRVWNRWRRHHLRPHAKRQPKPLGSAARVSGSRNPSGLRAWHARRGQCDRRSCSSWTRAGSHRVRFQQAGCPSPS